MATAILRPQDYRKLRFHPETLTPPPLKPRWNLNPNSNASRSSRRSSVGFKDNVRDRSMVVKFPAHNLVMGQVRILKRGEELKPGKELRSGGVAGGNGLTVRFENEEDLVLCSMDRLGPEPETVQMHIRVLKYKVVDGLYTGRRSSLRRR